MTNTRSRSAQNIMVLELEAEHQAQVLWWTGENCTVVIKATAENVGLKLCVRGGGRVGAWRSPTRRTSPSPTCSTSPRILSCLANRRPHRRPGLGHQGGCGGGRRWREGQSCSRGQGAWHPQAHGNWRSGVCCQVRGGPSRERGGGIMKFTVQ